MEDEFRNSGYEEEDGRVSEWEAGLPNVNDLPSLSQLLVPPELASAFSISPESHRSMIDVDRASRETISTIRNQSQQHLDKINDFDDDRGEEIVLEGEEAVDLALREGSGSDSRKLRRVDSGGSGRSGEGEVDHSTAKASKRNRLVWTPQLHKRFIEVVAHLGVKNAVPKTIMQLMNVEGLTRENVASHLQKYRLYVKRMLGSSEEGSSPSDSGGGSGGGGGGVAYAPQMVPMPYTPVQQMVANNSYNYNNMMMMMQSGNGFGSISQYQQHRMTSKDN